MAGPEGTVKLKIKEYLKSLEPSLWVFCPMSNGYGKRGVPDFVGVYRGRMFAIEAKAPGGKPKPWQERCMAEMANAGALVILADNIDTVIQAFKPFHDDPRYAL